MLPLVSLTLQRDVAGDLRCTYDISVVITYWRNGQRDRHLTVLHDTEKSAKVTALTQTKRDSGRISPLQPSSIDNYCSSKTEKLDRAAVKAPHEVLKLSQQTEVGPFTQLYYLIAREARSYRFLAL